MMYLRVAGLAQTHEVLSCVSAALGNGQNVVYFLHRSQPTFLEALFTQRMLCGITVADTLPRSAVFAVDIGTALVFIIFASFHRAVLLTELSVTKVGTAGVRTRSQRFLRHRFTSLQSKRLVLKCMQNLFA